MKQNLRRLWLPRHYRLLGRMVLLLAAIAGIATGASASHFRFGNVAWQHVPGTTNKIKFTVTIAYRGNYFSSTLPTVGSQISSGETLITGAGNHNIVLRVTSVQTAPNLNDSYFYGVDTFTQTYPTPAANTVNTYTAYFSSCCRINTSIMKNNNNGNYQVSATVKVGGGNDAPVSTIPPIVTLQQGLNPATYQLPATDPNNDAMTFTLTPANGAGAGTAPPAGMSVSTSGLVSFSTVGKTIGDLYNANFTITDALGATVQLDVLFQIVGQSTPPTFDYNAGQTPGNGATFQVQPGQPIVFNVKAQDADPGDIVALNAVGVPSGASFTPGSGNPVTKVFSWTPGTSQLGTYQVNFIATDNNAVQTNTVVNIIVSLRPQFIAPTPGNNSFFCAVPGTAISETFKASDPDPTDAVSLSIVSGLRPGMSFSPTLPTSFANPVSSNFSWTPAASDYGVRKIVIKATDTYNDFSLDSVTYVVDNPPSIISTPITTVRQGQFYSYTVVGADPDTTYGDQLNIESFQLPSFLSVVDNHNNTFTISGTPSASDTGTYHISVELEDAIAHTGNTHCGSVDQNYDLTVYPCNISIAGVVTNASCIGSSDGAVNITVSNAGPNVAYLWSNSATTEDISGLMAGNYSVSVADAYGCAASATYAVGTTPDNTPPTINNLPSNISVNNDAGVCGATITWTEPTVSDACPGSSISRTGGLANGSVFPKGTTTVTYTAVDAANNTTSQSFTVTVTDNEPPILSSVVIPASSVTISQLGRKSTYTNVKLNGVTNYIVVNPGASVVLTGNAAMSYDGGAGCSGCITQHYVGINGTALFCQTTNSSNVSSNINQGFVAPSTPGTYYITQGATWCNYCGQCTPAYNNVPAEAIAVVIVRGANSCQANITKNAAPGSCGAAVSYVTPVGFDNCTTVNVSQTAGSASGSTFPAGTTTNTFVATDAANLTTSCSFNVTIIDNQKPVITTNGNKNANATSGQCSAMVSVSATASDNCSVGAPNGVRSDAQALNAPYPVGTTTITWNVTDANGVAADAVTQTVTVTDNQNPVLTAPAAISANADAGKCYATITSRGTPTATDNCGVQPITNNAPANNQYSVGVNTVTYTVYDVNGNMSTATQTITVMDNQNPVIIAPANVSVNTNPGQCSATSVALGMPTVSDNCGVLSYTNNAPSVFPKGNTTVTYTVTDVNGRTATATQTVTVTDNELPMITAPVNVTTTTSADGTGNCTTTATLGFPTVSDNCGIFSIAAAVNGFIISPTSYNFPIGTTTVRWEILDNSFNFSYANQTVTVTDDEKPTLSNVPANVTVSCNAVPAPGSPTATDNCTANPTVTYLGQVSTQGSNPNAASYYNYTITRTWKAMDASGNSSAIGTQVITVQDVTAPTFTRPADITIYKTATCTYDASVAMTGDVVNEMDNCQTGLQATYTDAASMVCIGNLTIARTWHLVDASGNVAADQTQTIYVKDTSKPTFTVPAMATVYTSATCTYNASPSVTGTPANVADNCTPASGLQPTYTDVTANGSCPGNKVITRTWYLMDDCGNSAAPQTQVINVKDSTAPTFTVPPAATVYTTATCSYNVSPSVTGSPTNVADNCSTGLQSTYTDGPMAAGTCQGSKVFTRTWNLVDNCGNAAAPQTQVINIKDNTAPTFTRPADITIYTTATCTYNASPSATGNPTNVADNCSTGLQPTYSDVVANGTCAGSKVITRTWHLVDNCGNTATDQVQTINVKDNIAPTFTRPADATVYTTATCTYNAAPSVTGSPTNVTDNCATGLQPTYVDAIANGTCQGSKVITRTWKLVDACGNAAPDQVQIINVKDSTRPTFTAPPAITIYATASCSYNADPIVTGNATNIADNCSTGLLATYTDAVVINTTNGSKVITRTWKLTDNCGNMAPNQTQTITVLDNTPPVLTCAPNVTACDNFSGNSKTLTLGVTDNCSATTTTYTISGATTGTGTGNTITKSFSVGTSTIVWTVKDGANNTSTCTTTVLIRTAPVASYITSTADNFCNAIEVTGNGTPSGTYSYAWTYNNAAFASTQTIKLKVANSDGNYTLVVTDANGCASQPVSYNFQKQTLAAMYVLLGMKWVDLEDNNDVYNGSVGVTSQYGVANFDPYCSVASTGAFVKSYSIYTTSTANVPTKIYSPAVVTFPTMLLNTSNPSTLSSYTMTGNGTVTGNYKDLTISSGKTVTVTGNIFRKVLIKCGATVTFNANDISMESLELENGVTVKFADNTSMRVKDHVYVDEGCKVNSTGKKVTFYVKDPGTSTYNCYGNYYYCNNNSCANELFIVDGKNTNVIANVYMPSGKLRVHGNGYSCCWAQGVMCNMIGLFIAEEIESDGKNVAWYSYDCSMPPSCRMAMPVAEEVEEAKNYKVLVYPNPTTGQFTVQFAEVADADVRVTDIQGRLVSHSSIPASEMPSATIDITGQAAGVYMVEITQGSHTERLRMVKQ